MSEPPTLLQQREANGIHLKLFFFFFYVFNIFQHITCSLVPECLMLMRYNLLNVYLIIYHTVHKVTSDIYVYTHSSLLYFGRVLCNSHFLFYLCLRKGLKSSLEKRSPMTTSAMSRPASSTILVS